MEFKRNAEISKKFSQIKKIRNIIRDTYEPRKIEELWNLVLENANQILEIDVNNEFAIGEKIRAHLRLGQIEDAEQNSQKLLDIKPDNIIALVYLSKIERDRGNLEKEKQYLEKILEVSSEYEQQKIEMRLATVNRKIAEKEEKKEEATIKTDMELQEEKQKKYAQENIEVEEIYTIEAQNEYIDSIYKDFVEGKINKSELKDIAETLKKYPDEVKSAIVMADLYSKITDKQEEAAQMLIGLRKKENLTEEEKQKLEDEINKYRGIIHYNQKQEEGEQEQKDIREKQLKEQREYSKLILEKIKKGKITKEELPEIVNRLEKYPDKAKAIFLITKLYEIIEGRDAALQILLKYTNVGILSYDERKMITDMQTVISERKRIENSTTERIRRIYSKRDEIEQQKERSYKRQRQKEDVIKYIEEGKTIEQIEMILQSKGIIMSITAIRNIRDDYYANNENMKEKITQIRKTAVDLLDAGYEPTQVYRLIGREISLKEIKQLEKDIDTELSH